MDDLLRRLVAFAEGDENIRAVLLEGSRADPRGTIDEWSDYDVAFVTRSNEPYLRAEWFAGFVSQFGEVALAQTPDDPVLFDDAHDPLEHYAYLTQYADGLRLDLTFETAAYVRGVTLDSASAVLVDKDGGFAHVDPSDRDYWVKLPGNGAFHGCCNEFWWTAPYVAKAVARGQAIAALELLGKVVRPQFARMLTWLAGANGGPATTVGKHGTEVGAHVPAELYSALLASYPRADLAEIRFALDELVRAFPSVAQGVANALGYVYDAREGERASAFLDSNFRLVLKSDGSR
jgi:aminoglycoside 6-adenylyltransferase